VFTFRPNLHLFLASSPSGVLSQWQASECDITISKRLITEGSMNRILVTSLLALAASAPTILLISCANRGFTFGGEKPQVFSGTIETREIRVGSKAGGRVTGVLVEEGQAVEPDQPLVRFDVAELEAQRSQAEARIAQQRARLERLQHGARPEEVAQARASLAAAEADLGNAQSAFERAQRLRATGDISQQEFDSAKFRLENMRARRDAEKKRLALLQNGSRPQDVRAAQERDRQAQEAERLVRAGPRTEEIADAKAQLAEAQARLEQIKVQLAEGEVKAPSKAIVEAVSVRPGDLVTPNQTIAKLLERDQIWVRIYISEPQLGNIRVGQHAKVKVDTFRDQSFDGVIEQINEQGEFTPRNVQSRDERNHQVFGVKVKIDNREGKLKSGMAADVTLENR